MEIINSPANIEMVTKIVLEESLGLWLLANARMIKAERCKLKTMKLPAMITPKE